ncbi:MAG: Na+/H+ antiporter NhaA [Myxococcales bacterium]|nr:Na+/H+ antiporter NhaA [Myxococcales bacterium]
MTIRADSASADAQSRRRILRFTQPLVRFLRVESASGLVLAVCTVVALTAANSPWAASYGRMWNQNIRVGAGALELSYPLWYWINDGLMVLFFFVIGLEIKRELVSGELQEARRVVLPVAAAFGGVAAPIAIFLATHPEGPGRMGWAIPMATDIAFVVGCLALLGNRVPRGLKVFVLSLAIVDDIMAVVVIAVFYTDSLHTAWLLGALAGLGLVAVAVGMGVRAISIYFLIGTAVWLCTLKSGVHPTIAGVALGLLTPSRASLTDVAFLERLERAAFSLKTQPVDEVSRRNILSDLAFAARQAMSPLVRLETNLHPWVAFLIMPLFALANAGVPISGSALGEPIAFAAGVGLFVGKPIGILLAAWLTIRLGWAKLPGGVTWTALTGAASLCGVGFTMAIFIASLSVDGPLLVAAKTGVLVGSGLSIAVGISVLNAALRGQPAEFVQDVQT